MKNNTIPIGGEPFYSPAMLFTKAKNNFKTELKISYPDKYLTFTYGGYYSLRIILEHLNFNKNEIVLLPSYLCPTILIPFKEYGINYQFYKIKKDLSIHTIDLQNKITNDVKAVFFINYFGFKQPNHVLGKLLELKRKGILLIQDCVQDFYVKQDDVIGNYAFMSFRKFFPLEGSLIISDNKIEGIKISGLNRKYFYNKLKGRFLRYCHYKYGCKDKYFLNAFEVANNSYHITKNLKFTKYDEYVFNRMDIEKDKKIRKGNFALLIQNIKDISVINTLSDDVVPMAFPIRIKDRNSVHNELRKQSIFCPVHWHLSEEIDTVQFKESWELSNSILSIPINSVSDYTSIINILKKIL